MSDQYSDTITYLKYKGFATAFPNVSILYGEEQHNKDSITLKMTQGFANDPGEGGVEYPGLQILIRHSSIKTAYSIARWIKKTLSSASQEDLFIAFQTYQEWDDLITWDAWTEWSDNDSSVFGWEQTGSAIDLGRDSQNDRARLSDNYIIYSNEEE